MRLPGRSPRRVMISITSLIDVLFLLLIFLLVSSTFLEQPGIKLELPEAGSSDPLEQKEYVLSLSADGSIFLNQEALSIDELESRMRRVLPEMKDGALLLKADREVSHGLVVRVMDRVKKSGVKKLVIATRMED